MNEQPQPLHAVAVEKAYRKGEHAVDVLRGVNLTVNPGELISVVGQSGSGKSTLMHLLGLLDSPDVGEVRLGTDRIDHLPSRTRDRLRNRVFGFVFQFYHLLPELSLLENVLTPLMIRHSMPTYWKNRKVYRARAEEILERVGLGHRLTHTPKELSGGEMQRAAIARALISEPQILLADEPTGNLDGEVEAEVIGLLRELNREGLTVVMVTHDDALAATADRTVRLIRGRVEDRTEPLRRAA
jgi:lipoprotein-releasing system ATP-binding protein